MGGTHAIFLVRGDVRRFNLPVAPVAPAVYLADGWRSALLSAALMLATVALAFWLGGA